LTAHGFRETLTSVADLAETLQALGRCEAVVGDLRRERDRLPAAIAREEQEAEAAREAIARQRGRCSELQAQHRACERDLQDAEAQRSKFHTQSTQVKTNAEYTALLREIDQVGSRISELETAILQVMEDGDEAARELERIEVEEREREQVHLKQAEELRAQLTQTERALEVEEGERAQLVSLLPSETRGRYERVCREGGLGTSPIVGRSCARCHRDVPFQTINLVRNGDLHHCGNCGRILVPES